MQEIEELFLAATRFESKKARILGWAGASRGEKMVDEAVALHCP